MADALSRIGWNVKWEERDEDTSKVATIGGSQDEIGPCKDVRLDINDFQLQQERDPTLKPHISTHRNEHGLFTRDHKKQVLLPVSHVPTILSLAHDETGPK